jgi:transketolase
LLGGSADLAGSNLTLWQGAKGISGEDPDGNYIYYGVREFGMTAIINGIALHGGFIPYGGTFLIFMEYARNALRMAALMRQRNIQVYTHDSIGLGEDGPTHQPVEQIANLRTTPNLSTWRPCDTVETAVAWRAALERADGPTALVLSRQGLPHQSRSKEQVAAIGRGGYVLVDCEETPDVIVIATGSEVGIAVEAQAELAQQGQRVRVVSMPCADRFDAQDQAWRESVLPDSVRKRVAVEAGVSSPWYKYVGLDGVVLGLDRFGESGPAPQLMEYFGFTSAAVKKAVESLLQQ